MKYDIFISYRREGGYDTAKHLNDLLVRDGYMVSFDIDTLRSGDFDTQLLERIDQCKDFILIVDQHAFDRTLNPNFNPKNDWLRCELAYALEKNKNIVPVFLSGVTGFPTNLPNDIAEVAKKNGPEYNQYYFNDFYKTLKNRFLHKKEFSLRGLILFALLLMGMAAFLYGRYSNDSNTTTGVIITQNKSLDIQSVKFSIKEDIRIIDSLFSVKGDVIENRREDEILKFAYNFGKIWLEYEKWINNYNFDEFQEKHEDVIKSLFNKTTAEEDFVLEHMRELYISNRAVLFDLDDYDDLSYEDIKAHRDVIQSTWISKYIECEEAWKSKIARRVSFFEQVNYKEENCKSSLAERKAIYMDPDYYKYDLVLLDYCVRRLTI